MARLRSSIIHKCLRTGRNSPAPRKPISETGSLETLPSSEESANFQFLSGGVLSGPDAPAFAQSASTPSRLDDPMVWAPRDLDQLISDPKEALDVFDFESVAEEESVASAFRLHGL